MFYALIETGEYEETHVEIYKLNKLDKDKFIEFCKDTEDLCEDLRLVLFCENIELIENKYLDYEIKTTETLLIHLKNEYDFIFEYKDHWVNHTQRKDLIISTYEKLLSYKFLEVE